jgi:hypothetical protein
MDKKPLIGVSICAVVLLILGSLSNVVGYQTVQSSNQKVINSRVDQKELLFQTIFDIANNKEIRKLILNSEVRQSGFFYPDVRFSIFNSQVLTKNQLKQIYLIGLMLSKTISKSRIHSIVERYRVNNQWEQKEITAVIEKDTVLNGKLTQLSNSKCNCENDNITNWNFPILCLLLVPFVLFAWIIYFAAGWFIRSEILAFLCDILSEILLIIATVIMSVLHCDW